MLAASIVSLSVGIVLAQRFKVMALFPAFFVTLLLAAGALILRPDAASRTELTTLVVIVGLQIGYLLGIALFNVAALVRLNRRRGASLTSSLLPRRPAH